MNLLEDDFKLREILSEKICNICLCDGRILHPIKDQAAVKFYLDCISEIPLGSNSNWNIQCPEACWECKALLQKVVSFKQRIQDANRLLQAYSNKNIQELSNGIVRQSRLSVNVNQSIDISPTIEIEERRGEQELRSVYVKNEGYEIVKDESWDLEEEIKAKDKICLNEDSLDNIIDVPWPLEDNNTEIKLERSFLNEDQNSMDNYLQSKGTASPERHKHIELKLEQNIISLEGIPKSQDIVFITSARKRGRPRRGAKERDRDGSNSSVARDSKKKRQRKRKKQKDVLPVNSSQEELLQESHQLGKHLSFNLDLEGKHSQEVLSPADALKKDYNKHSKSKHQQVQRTRVECRACDKTFSHRAGLLNHTGNVHRQLDKYPCERCGKMFKWRNSLRKHAEQHDKTNKTSDTKPFCVPCDVSFASICSYKRHLRNSLKHVTQNQLKFVCDHCQRRYANKTKLRDHIEEKHLNRTFHCHICLKPSKNRVCLDQHIRNVHKGRPNNKICQYCGKGFPTKMQLESHIRAHTGERPYICEYCPTTFSQQSNLYKHYRQIHMNKFKNKVKDKGVLGDGLIVNVGQVCLDQDSKVLPVFQYNII